jgi:nucleotide-binding universal stress UspA family protein
MKLLVGIDVEGKSEKAIALLRRMEFAEAEWHLAHARPPIDPHPLRIKLSVEEAQELTSVHWDASKVLDPQVQALKSQGIAADPHVLDGPVAASLLALADQLSADLIAIGSEPHGGIGSILIGSVGRAVALNNKSFVIARGDVPNRGPVKAVFATDHSPYARRALETLIRLRPKGISEIVVLTAGDMWELSQLGNYFDLLDDADIEGLTFHQILEMRGKEAVQKLGVAGMNATVEIRHGFVSHAISESMEEHNADLLVLGAQGHGFLERLIIGSIALEQVVSCPRSLMVIRSQSA